MFYQDSPCELFDRSGHNRLNSIYAIHVIRNGNITHDKNKFRLLKTPNYRKLGMNSQIISSFRNIVKHCSLEPCRTRSLDTTSTFKRRLEVHPYEMPKYKCGADYVINKIR